MSLLVVGTLAYDSVETPAGKADDVLGGAATYFSYAASFFTPVRLVGVIGEDFREEDKALLTGHGVDFDGVVVGRGESFRWAGSYLRDLNIADTKATHLNVLDGWEPTVPDAYRDSKFVFLANSPPALQASVLEQVSDKAFVAMDTMNLWIDTARDDLEALMTRVDMLVCNDAEAMSIAGDDSLIKAGRRLLEMGPRIALVKKGEHGAFLFNREFFYAIPAYPVDTVVDPTGAGDSFAGGVMGCLASAGLVSTGLAGEEHFRRALIYGSVVASFTVQDFSLEQLKSVSRADIDQRYEEFLRFTAHP